MEDSRVVKLSRDDEESACVLVHITQTGPEPLDVRLEASEGDAPYFATLKHSRVASLRVRNSPASENEWEAILQSIFSREPLPDIQATANIQGTTSMSITVRKQIQGITQRLGSISLKCDPSEELDIFQWCISSQKALEKSDEALAQSVAHAKELEVAVSDLKSQLEELIATKQDDETALLQKFQALLNEKKVKIREQQKIIAATSPLQGGQQASQQFHTGASPSPPRRSANKSRPAKRKAAAAALEEESSEDEASVEIEDDLIKSEPRDSDEMDTPSETDATASGGDEDDDDEDQPARAAIRAGVESSDAKGNAAQQRAPPIPTKKTAEAPPPPRSLPFVKRKVSEQKVAPKPAESDPETEDDEL